MAADSRPAEEIDAAVYADRAAEVRVEHNPDQTLIAVDTQEGQAVATVDVGHLPLDDAVQLAHDVRDAFDRATTAGGGD